MSDLTRPRLCLDETETRRAEKNFLGDRASPLSQGLDDRPPTPPPTLYECLDPPLHGKLCCDHEMNDQIKENQCKLNLISLSVLIKHEKIGAVQDYI